MYDDLYDLEPAVAIDILADEANIYIDDKIYRKSGESIKFCVTRKIGEIYHEERKKAKGKRKDRKQIIATAFAMCKRSK